MNLNYTKMKYKYMWELVVIERVEQYVHLSHQIKLGKKNQQAEVSRRLWSTKR